MKRDQKGPSRRCRTGLGVVVLIAALRSRHAPQNQPGADASKPKDPTPSSYDQITPVLLGKESFQAVMARDKAEKESTIARQKKLLEERYQLDSRPDAKVTMSRGKPIQVGPTARLPEGTNWDQLAAMPSDEIRERGLFPKGFLPLPHPKHEVGGMVFPQMEIKLLPRLERVRYRFRPSRAFSTGVPACHLFDLAVGPGGRVARQSRDCRKFSGDLRRHLELQRPGGPAIAGDAVSPAAV